MRVNVVVGNRVMPNRFACQELMSENDNKYSNHDFAFVDNNRDDALRAPALLSRLLSTIPRERAQTSPRVCPCASCFPNESLAAKLSSPSLSGKLPNERLEAKHSAISLSKNFLMEAPTQKSYLPTGKLLPKKLRRL